MPRPDPIPSPRRSTLRQFLRIMRWLALFSIIVAAVAVLLVARGEADVRVHLLVATALGVGLTVLLAGALMSLVFLSSSSGHDDQAGASRRREEGEE